MELPSCTCQQVLKNIDELFEREELSAVADVGWPDMFNSGLFVFEPSDKTFETLLALAVKDGSFDGITIYLLDVTEMHFFIYTISVYARLQWMSITQHIRNHTQTVWPKTRKNM